MGYSDVGPLAVDNRGPISEGRVGPAPAVLPTKGPQRVLEESNVLDINTVIG